MSVIDDPHVISAIVCITAAIAVALIGCCLGVK